MTDRQTRRRRCIATLASVTQCAVLNWHQQQERVTTTTIPLMDHFHFLSSASCASALILISLSEPFSLPHPLLVTRLLIQRSSS